MSAKKTAIKELLRAKDLYIKPAIDTVRTVGIRSYLSAKKPSSSLMHEAGILDAAGINIAKDFIKKKLIETDASIKGIAFTLGGSVKSSAKFKDALKALKKVRTSMEASKYKYKKINLKNKIMAKALFAIPAAVAMDRMYTDGHGTAKDKN